MEEFKLVPEESPLLHISPDEITVLFYILGIGIAESLTIDELRVLGSGLFLMGEVFLTIVSQRILFNDALAAQQEHDAIKKTEQSIEELQSQNKTLQNQIEHLERQVNELIKTQI